jgi:hypothetical protein
LSNPRLALGAGQGIIILYQNNFENPVVPPGNFCASDFSQTPVNTMYPPGFQQVFTPELLLINGPAERYSDPSGIGGNYALGMLQSIQDDKLALTFDTKGNAFLNVNIDISAIGADSCGIAGIIPGQPQFRLTLYDTPTGTFNFNSPGTQLDTIVITGDGVPQRFIFDWTHHVISLNAAGATNSRVTLVWDVIGGGYAAFDNLLITASASSAAPEIDVLGNGVSIANGDVTPSLADHTDFGSVDVSSGVVARTFTIANVGDDTLTMAENAVSLSGTGSSHFSIATQPAVSITPSGSATFTITFDPAAVGVLAATVSIANDDSDENPYEFAIQGTGLGLNQAPIAAAGPDQTVAANALVSLDGSGSSDPDNHLPLTYGWTQTGGPVVVLSSATLPQPTFTAPAGPAVLTFTLTVTDSLGLADSTPDEIVITVDQGPATGGHVYYLPWIFKQFTSGPDLVVESLIAGSDEVIVVIKNIGSDPVIDAFWVDVYLNPATPPTRVNQRWQDVGDQGLVWGIVGPALPLEPGESLTLTIGDAYYSPGRSSFTEPLPAGSPVYAQVDSVNLLTGYGGVLESHEISGGSYNNILQLVPTAGVNPATDGGEASLSSAAGLPLR